MTQLHGEGDDVFYHGRQYPWGHAVVRHVSDAGYVLDLDHQGEVVVGLDEVSAPPEPVTVSDGVVTAPISGAKASNP